jgi:hypothetical protein
VAMLQSRPSAKLLGGSKFLGLHPKLAPLGRKVRMATPYLHTTTSAQVCLPVSGCGSEVNILFPGNYVHITVLKIYQAGAGSTLEECGAVRERG